MRMKLIASQQAIGVQPGEDGGIVVLTKKADKANKPASHIQVANVPEVSDERRVYVVDLGQGFFQVTAHYGFL